MKTRSELIKKAAQKVGDDFAKATDVKVGFIPSKNIASDSGELVVIFYAMSNGSLNEVAQTYIRVNTNKTDVNAMMSAPTICTIQEYIEEA